MDFEECAHAVFFLLRDNIMPTWEDERNKGAGGWSFTVSLNHFFYVWTHMSMLFIWCQRHHPLQHNLYTVNPLSV